MTINKAQQLHLVPEKWRVEFVANMKERVHRLMMDSVADHLSAPSAAHGGARPTRPLRNQGSEPGVSAHTIDNEKEAAIIRAQTRVEIKIDSLTSELFKQLQVQIMMLLSELGELHASAPGPIATSVIGCNSSSNSSCSRHSAAVSPKKSR